MRFMTVSVDKENYLLGKTNFMRQSLIVSYKKDHLCVRLASSVGRASERDPSIRGFKEPHVRLALYLE